jgi:hypothetical protein
MGRKKLNRVKHNITLHPDTSKQLKRMVKKYGMTASDILAWCFVAKMEEHRYIIKQEPKADF